VVGKKSLRKAANKKMSVADRGASISFFCVIGREKNRQSDIRERERGKEIYNKKRQRQKERGERHKDG
jgi:hypothetical protein